MMTLSPTPEIEPLSVEAWKRVENEVFAALDRSDPVPAPAPQLGRKRARVLVACVTLAAAAAIILALSRPSLRPGGSDSLTRIETADAPVEISIAGSTIIVDSYSAALYGSYGGSVTVVLERGGVHCSVARRTGEDRFVVHADDVAVRVVGTIFSVRRTERAVTVGVERGQVDVCRGALCERLGPGQEWPRQDVVVAAPKPAATPGPRRPDEKKKPARRAEPWDSKYRRAHRLEASDPQAAVALYRELIDEADDNWAALSVYALGQFYAGKGDKRQARVWFERYLSDYPDGVNRADVVVDLDAL